MRPKRTHTAETRAKMSAARKAYWAGTPVEPNRCADCSTTVHPRAVRCRSCATLFRHEPVSVGLRFERLTVLGEAPRRGARRYLSLQCECGTVIEADLAHLRGGHTRSCGCLMREVAAQNATTHGLRNSREFRIWSGMRQRCQNPKALYWDRYGGRGITVCERWQTFENFYADMGPSPSPKYTLDRVDNDQGYSPENCRWATSTTQQRNRTSNHQLTYDGMTLTIAEWADRTGIKAATLYRRCKAGWDVARTLTTPARTLTRRSTTPSETAADGVP